MRAGILYLYWTDARADGLDFAVGRHKADEVPESEWARFRDGQTAIDFANAYGEKHDFDVHLLPSVENRLPNPVASAS